MSFFYPLSFSYEKRMHLKQNAALKDDHGKYVKHFDNAFVKALPPTSGSRKISRVCAICADALVSEEDATNENFSKNMNLVCHRTNCLIKFGYLPNISSFEKKMGSQAGRQELFINTEKLKASKANERIYPTLEEIPIEYREIFIKLENYPLASRIMEIDALYFDYALKNQIKTEEPLKKTSDPYLSKLAAYRQKCMNLLKLKS